MPRIFDNIEQQLINALQETLHVSNREASVKFYASTDRKRKSRGGRKLRPPLELGKGFSFIVR